MSSSLFKEISEALSEHLLFVVNEDLKVEERSETFKKTFPGLKDLGSGTNWTLDSGRDLRETLTAGLNGEHISDLLYINGAEKKGMTLKIRPLSGYSSGKHILGILEPTAPTVKDEIKYNIDVYNSLLDLLPDAVLILTTGFIIRDVSRQSLKLFSAGVSSNLLGKNVLDLIHSRDREIFTQNFNDAVENDRSVSFTITYKNQLSERFMGDTNMSLLKRSRSSSDLVIVTIRNSSGYRDEIDNLNYRLDEFKKMLNIQPSYVWSTKIFENGQDLYTVAHPRVRRAPGMERQFR